MPMTSRGTAGSGRPCASTASRSSRWCSWQVRKREIVNTDPVDEIDSRVVEVRVHVHPEDAPRLARLSHMRVQLVIGG